MVLQTDLKLLEKELYGHKNVISSIFSLNSTIFGIV